MFFVPSEGGGWGGGKAVVLGQEGGRKFQDWEEGLKSFSTVGFQML